ncbi:uncharacterized protein N7529_009478 [Penicillium soppii]|uniref:uncharacterized protein n=1 Tax=Penicillium soppii TaxID=69789 RepID=UPI0025483BFD|nr:uncharacterized protein N7529_009478 [Penicillium soppii]KAJ5855534.1 hypothetical protein N7529_009478 [Penicillium soppii]
MRFDNKYLHQNLFQALPLELGLQVFGSILGYIVVVLVMSNRQTWITQSHLWCLTGIQILKTIVVIITGGHDSNHLTYQTVPKDPNWIFVGPEFHSLHHVYPDRYIGSFIKLFDWIWGTAYTFRGKRFVITGASGAFGQAMITELECEGVQSIHKLEFGYEWDHHDYEKALPTLSTCDVLIMAHGTESSDGVKFNCDSSAQLVQLFKQHRKNKRSNPTLPEVWYIGSEIEFRPSWGNKELEPYSESKRRFLPYARSFFDDPDILYRHIVSSSFPSSIGYALFSGRWAAKTTMWWIRRGARYIPVTHTGVAFFHFYKFIYYFVSLQGDGDVKSPIK